MGMSMGISTDWTARVVRLCDGYGNQIDEFLIQAWVIDRYWTTTLEQISLRAMRASGMIVEHRLKTKKQ
jgi:hypothetical protein